MKHYHEQQPVMQDDPNQDVATQESIADGAALTGEPESAE